MTGFAQVRSTFTSGAAQLEFAVSLKSVNHRYLDLQMRLPSESDALEMKLRRLLKERLVRGHVDLTLSLDRSAGSAMQLNRELVTGYLQAYRTAAQEFGITAEPDLNNVLRMPGALAGSSSITQEPGFDEAVLAATEQAIKKLVEMKDEEGRGIDRELRERMEHLSRATAEVAKLRGAVSRAYLEKVQARMAELIGGKADQDRILQEAAMLAERSDIQEEIVRLQQHISHFLQLLESPSEAGKKLDFLLQELNREANTLLSKTTGVSGDGLRITELGLAMKSEIEKAREQVQNIE